MDGYEPVGVSPDGKLAALTKTENNVTNLYIVDFTEPENITLLQQNITDATWLPGTNWIGFISSAGNTPQVFIVHPDGSDLTQVTKSSLGAGKLNPAFNNGIFWGEGTDSIRQTKWTKTDGTELAYPSIASVALNGEIIITISPNGLTPKGFCFGCNIIIFDTATGEQNEISLLNELSVPDDITFTSMYVNPLPNGQWLVDGSISDSGNDQYNSGNTKYYIYSPNGKSYPIDLLQDYADLPDNADFYNWLGYPHFWSVSPDGHKTVIERVVYTKEPLDYKKSFYLFDLATFETQLLPNLGFSNKEDITSGFFIDSIFWINIP